MGTDRRENGLLDPTNLRLLAELQSDARVSQAELGRRVGLSAPAVAERLARLEREGGIAGYRAEISPEALGYAFAAGLRIPPAPRQIPQGGEGGPETPPGGGGPAGTRGGCLFLKLPRRRPPPPREG